jgi:uncharacterized protein YdhG (YjbR/CyaY superfamily)
MATSDKKQTDEAAVLAAIAAMKPAEHRTIGEKLHEIITANAPSLQPRTWYGMPAYSNGNKVICYFRGSEKFGERYVTFGFNPEATLDDGSMWPIVYALTELTNEHEATIAALVRKSVS